MAAALDQFTILLMASPTFWMLRPKKKKTLESPLSVSHAPLSHLSGNSVDATFKTPPKFNSFPLRQLLPWTQPPAAPPSYSQLSTAASLSPLSTLRAAAPGTHHSCHSFAQNPASQLIHSKSQSPHGGLLICSSLEHHFSNFLSDSISATFASWVFLEHARKTPTSSLCMNCPSG